MNWIWMIWIYLDDMDMVDMDMDDMDMICRVCKLDKIQGRPRFARSCIGGGWWLIYNWLERNQMDVGRYLHI